ncbi:carbon storage regulator CsrA [Hydrogenimonas urashimensis]|uniref:carbon storage regulator CsrA n=1 Tax=Hydrogenimonas urashimensis TaxID=2740515 RepID=UPI0019160B61|nr:carbon storage regulator CsrA [Hydrogenimonas urashimensis]
MLVLTRKQDEAIRIGDDIVIKIVSTDRNSVRLGIEAPGNVTILREELVQAVKTENRKAVGETDKEALADLKAKLLKP